MFTRPVSCIVIFTFIFSLIGPYKPATAAVSVLGLPAPGTMVNLSPAYQPVIIKGLTVHKDNPFLFDFIVDVGQEKMSGEPLKREGERLIKYFLASLAIPDKDVWVNLSPYEKDKMIPEVLGQTDMGRDLLEQDYILKQITASLIYPERELGKTFWDTVYSKAGARYGTTQIPVNTFNKVWIMADRAEVFEHNQTAFVVDQHLKVMLEEDYLALAKHNGIQSSSTHNTHSISSQIVREIILPELEKEVNTGKNFANLRQIFNSIILANWYKKNLQQALLNQVYADKSKVKGINLDDPSIKQQIYEQYLKAYKKGVFNYIKEDINTADGQAMPRKYFSGGINEAMAATPKVTTDAALLAAALPDRAMMDFTTIVSTNKPALPLVDVAITGQKDHAMSADLNALKEQYTAALKDFLKLGPESKTAEDRLWGIREEYVDTLKDEGVPDDQILGQLSVIINATEGTQVYKDYEIELIGGLMRSYMPGLKSIKNISASTGKKDAAMAAVISKIENEKYVAKARHILGGTNFEDVTFGKKISLIVTIPWITEKILASLKEIKIEPAVGELEDGDIMVIPWKSLDDTQAKAVIDILFQYSDAAMGVQDEANPRQVYTSIASMREAGRKSRILGGTFIITTKNRGEIKIRISSISKSAISGIDKKSNAVYIFEDEFVSARQADAAMTQEGEINSIIVEKLGVNPQDVFAGANIVDHLGADSFSKMDLLSALEDHFDLYISDEEAEKIRTVGDIYAYIKARQESDAAMGSDQFQRLKENYKKALIEYFRPGYENVTDADGLWAAREAFIDAMRSLGTSDVEIQRQLSIIIGTKDLYRSKEEFEKDRITAMVFSYKSNPGTGKQDTAMVAEPFSDNLTIQVQKDEGTRRKVTFALKTKEGRGAYTYISRPVGEPLNTTAVLIVAYLETLLEKDFSELEYFASENDIKFSQSFKTFVLADVFNNGPIDDENGKLYSRLGTIISPLSMSDKAMASQMSLELDEKTSNKLDELGWKVGDLALQYYRDYPDVKKRINFQGYVLLQLAKRQGVATSNYSDNLTIQVQMWGSTRKVTFVHKELTARDFDVLSRPKDESPQATASLIAEYLKIVGEGSRITVAKWLLKKGITVYDWDLLDEILNWGKTVKIDSPNNYPKLTRMISLLSIPDRAMTVSDKAVWSQIKRSNAFPGGIDLNTANGMQWKVSKDGRGVEMDIDPAIIARIKQQGVDSLSPVVFKITSVANIWSLMGLAAPR